MKARSSEVLWGAVLAGALLVAAGCGGGGSSSNSSTTSSTSANAGSTASPDATPPIPVQNCPTPKCSTPFPAPSATAQSPKTTIPPPINLAVLGGAQLGFTSETVAAAQGATAGGGPNGGFQLEITVFSANKTWMQTLRLPYGGAGAAPTLATCYDATGTQSAPCTP